VDEKEDEEEDGLELLPMLLSFDGKEDGEEDEEEEGEEDGLCCCCIREAASLHKTTVARTTVSMSHPLLKAESCGTTHFLMSQDENEGKGHHRNTHHRPRPRCFGRTETTLLV
jgi:hypothetical protein